MFLVDGNVAAYLATESNQTRDAQHAARVLAVADRLEPTLTQALGANLALDLTSRHR
jgi:hypothetical protein